MEQKSRNSVYEEQILSVFRENKFETSEYEKQIMQDIEGLERYAQKIPDGEQTKGEILRLTVWGRHMLQVINLDPMTGLYNRRILPRIRNLDNYIAVMIDMDNFKQVNDMFGHQMGDEVIRKMAEIILHNTRATDYPCHIGGDEFLIIYTNCDIEVIKKRVEDILDQILKMITLPNFTATSSAGIAVGNGKDSFVETIKMADEALYKSKEHGKNCITVHQDKIIKPNNYYKSGGNYD